MSTLARLIFNDGTVFTGKFFTNPKSVSGEVVFHTGMTGYQEVLTDPSYKGQMVLMTYPMIGNYGISESEAESRALFLSAFLVKEYVDFYSHFRSKMTLKAYMELHGIPGAEGFDTRAITRYVREKGATVALLTASDEPLSNLIAQVRHLPSMQGCELASSVSIDQPYVWKKPETILFKVAVIDCGVKKSILEFLTAQGCYCTVYPYTVTADELQAYDGLFLSNGPGDPEPLKEMVNLVRSFVGKKPIFGICLGHQILAQALGAKTYKLPFGHHGANHPVKNLITQKIEITSQNHGFAVDEKTLPSDVKVTHRNLNDHTIEGIAHAHHPVFSVQYHPESAPGPHDSLYLFNEFIDMMRRV